MSVDLDALDRLAAAATPGPWRSQGWVPTWAYVPLMDARHNVVATMYHDASHDYTRNEVAANAAFIAASREAVPELIAALRASQAENARLTAENEKWEAAAKATDIYPYLQDALARMGTVGPRGIREMVTYCAGLQAENARLREALAPFASRADSYNWAQDDHQTYASVHSLRRARAALTQGQET